MFNKREIMVNAWGIYRKYEGITFGEALHRSWNQAKAITINAQRVADAQAQAGITEECRTWYGWRQIGYEVVHGSRALFGVDLIYASKGDGEIYKARFFGASQVQRVA